MGETGEDVGMETTDEQRGAVRRDECRMNGHRFDELVTMGSLAPQAVLCANCGTRWRIHPDDSEKEFDLRAGEREPDDA